MKGETQAVHLANIMQKHKCYPQYELALPFVKIKKTMIKKLSHGDVLLLGLNYLELILLSEGKICANVVMNKAHNSLKIKIISIEEDSIKKNDSKKYEVFKFSFGMLQSRKLEVGHKIDIASLNLDEILLSVDGKNIAKGSLVNVDEEIAIEISEVYKNEK